MSTVYTFHGKKMLGFSLATRSEWDKVQSPSGYFLGHLDQLLVSITPYCLSPPRFANGTGGNTSSTFKLL